MKSGKIELTEEGYLPDRHSLAHKDWYYSNNSECFYCKPCEDKLIGISLGELYDLALKNNVRIFDLDELVGGISENS